MHYVCVLYLTCYGLLKLELHDLTRTWVESNSFKWGLLNTYWGHALWSFGAELAF